jgi:glycine oxidase
MDAVVIGSGLIGLGIARELAMRGAAVTVVDPNEPVRAASWAAAGMLAPYTEAIEQSALESLCKRSLSLYPAFVAALQAETGVDARLQLSGILEAAYDDAQWERLQQRAEALRAAGVRHQVLAADAARDRESALASDVRGALLVEGEGQVDNRRLGSALHAAALSAGVRVVADAGEVAIEADERRVRGVRTGYGFVSAPVIVNAAGAWAAEVPGLPAIASPPVFPVKGQMLALTLPPDLVRGVTWVPGAYLVPRRDGRLLIGATVELVGFDLRITAQGMHQLLSAALRALPPLRDLGIVETWAGLRPGSPDGFPFIGRTALDGLYDANGHGRNGVLLAPVTAEAIADMVEGKPVAPDVKACAPQRVRAEVGAAAAAAPA